MHASIPVSAASATAAGPAELTDAPDYDAGVKVGAVLLSIFLPLIALIVALVLRGSERSPRRRQFLTGWAVGTAAWMCTGFVIALIGFAGLAHSVAGCKGGINQLVPPSFTSTDGHHWTATYTCMNGGTIDKPAPPGSVP